jgi:integrase
VRPEVRERLDRLGRERALIYKTLVLSGLRKGELCSLTVAHLHLDAATPYADLDAADEKNREGSAIALRDDLAADLRGWLADKLQRLQSEAGAVGGAIPARLAPDTPLFDVPTGILRIFDRDLKMAGIAKKDEHGRTLDVHAMRTTFGTLMSKGGVSPRTAQAAMRHSDIRLTIERLHRPEVARRAGRARCAADALPSRRPGGERGCAGDGDRRGSEFACTNACTNSRQSWTIAVNPCPSVHERRFEAIRRKWKP